MSVQPETHSSDADTQSAPAPPKRSMSRTQKILFFATGWLIVLMPFLFWWNTWFGRHLSDQQITEFLHDDKKPRHMQHALVQLGDRMSHGDAAAKRWYPDLIRLSAYPVEEVTIAGNLGGMLNNIEMVGSDLEFRSSISSPSLLISGLTVAGT